MSDHASPTRPQRPVFRNIHVSQIVSYRLPPAGIVSILHRVSGGRFLWTPQAKRGWGAMRLTTTGRRSGKPRTVIVGYLEDVFTPVVLAMNGWDDGHPAWWLNLEANPEAVIKVKGGPERQVRARRVVGPERDRLWQMWAAVDEGLDAYAAGRSVETPVVVFEPRPPA